MFRIDPGPCPICDAAHCGCTPDRPVDAIVVLGQRDAMVADPVVEPEPGPFTTSTYQRKIHGLKRPRP